MIVVTDPSSENSRSRAGLWLFIGLAIESLLWSAFKVPDTQSFNAFAFGDSGSNYTAQALMRQGARPIIDFAWIYGLLPLEFGRIWTSIVGDSPAGYHLSLIVGHLVIVAGMASFLRAMEVPTSGIILVAVTMPYWLASSYPNWTHVLETALLIHALAAQSRKQNRLALALVTASLFVKPSMAYVYGAWLVAGMIAEAVNRPGRIFSQLARNFLPAAITGLGLGGYFAARYGAGPLSETLWPTTAMKIYQAGNFGFFFGVGKSFWLPGGANLRYYLGGITAFWLISSLILIAYAFAIALESLNRRERPSGHDQIIVTCAFLHAIFVLFFFGPPTSWFYYCFVLVMGMASLATRGRWWDKLTYVLVVVGLVSLYSTVNGYARLWRTTTATATTSGLWAEPGLAKEWSEILEKCHGQRAVFLCGVGDADLLARDFLPPVSCFLSPGMDQTPDALAKAKQIEGADLVVIPLIWETNVEHILKWPEFASVLSTFHPATRGTYFLVLKRNEG